MITARQAYISNLEREIIHPKWKLLSFDSSVDTWGEIIDGTYGQTPTDLTPYVVRIEYTFDKLQVTLSDDAALVFHPDSGALRTKIKSGRIIRLLEGFEGLAEADWLWTFSGEIEGTYTWAQQRGQVITAQFSVFSRGNSQAWKRRHITSNNFTIGSDWGSMFHNIATDIMLLEAAEIDVPNPFGVIFDKNSNQVVNYPPWDALEQLAFSLSAKPWFNGKGQLALYSTRQDRVTLSLENDKHLRKYESRGSSGEVINKVILTYLSNSLSRVDGPDQTLGTATITAGFFTSSVDVDVYYSDERKTRCDNPRLLIKQSANAGLLPFCDESLTKIDEFHSRITLDVSVWLPVLATYMVALYLAYGLLPLDTGEGGGIGVVEVIITKPYGRFAQSVVLVAILLLMMCLGTGTYEVWGTPYELVYLEEQAIAIKSGTEFWQEREKEIRNDFISTLEQAQPLAVNELHFEAMRENPRTLLLRYDPRIEPGDVIQLSTTVKVWVENVSRPLTRNSSEVATMTVTGYRTVI